MSDEEEKPKNNTSFIIVIIIVGILLLGIAVATAIFFYLLYSPVNITRPKIYKYDSGSRHISPRNSTSKMTPSTY